MSNLKQVAVAVAVVGSMAAVTFGSARPAEAQVYIQPPRVVVHVPPIPIPRIWRRPRVVRVVVAPPPVYYYPPPPPVYVAPPPPVYIPPPAPVQIVAPPPEPYYVAPAPQNLPPIPPPIVAPPPYTYQAPPPAPVVVTPAPVVVVKAKPAPPRIQVGIGARASGFASSDKDSSFGGGGELLLRASPYVTLELAAEYQRSYRRSNTADRFTRSDVPLLFGTRFNLARAQWAVKPYLVGALGIDFAQQDLKVYTEKATFFEYQAGGGFEFRLGQHMALTADVRFMGRTRLDKDEQATLAVKYIDQQPVHPLANQYGVQARLGVQAYF